MMKHLIMAGTLLTHSAQAETFFEKHAEGWHWYEKIQEKSEEDGVTPHTESLTPTQQIEQQQKELKESLHKAVISGNPVDVLAYQKKQRALMDQSQRFSNAWQVSIQMNPQLDERVTNPQEQFARHELYAHQREKRQELIKSLSKEYGLFYFFRADCKFCSLMAPVVQGFSRVYGWDVVAVSVDGGQLNEFPQALPDNGISESFSIKAYPALVAVHGESGQPIPLAYGVVSLDELERRIEVMVSYFKNQEIQNEE